VYEQMRQLVMAGQYLDMLLHALGGFSVADALRVATLKTGKYTVEGPLHLGAAAAGASPQLLEALSSYAIPLGEAFQLRDDVLGVFGDPDRTGKPVGEDLRDGKRTLLVVLAMLAATDEQAAPLRRGLGDRDLDEAGVAALRAVIVETGALARVEERIAERRNAACAALRFTALRVEAGAALEELAERVTRRDS
jgi:geranylgeranyl diphosphate synthase type I